AWVKGDWSRRGGERGARLPPPAVGGEGGGGGMQHDRGVQQPPPHPSPACGGGSRPSLSLAFTPFRSGALQHHLLSPESASAARRRLASIAAMRACALLIQAAAGARALGGSSPSSATVPARSPRPAFASLRATIAAPSLPGASSTRRGRPGFSPLSCRPPRTPARA